MSGVICLTTIHQLPGLHNHWEMMVLALFLVYVHEKNKMRIIFDRWPPLFKHCDSQKKNCWVEIKRLSFSLSALKAEKLCMAYWINISNSKSCNLKKKKKEKMSNLMLWLHKRLFCNTIQPCFLVTWWVGHHVSILYLSSIGFRTHTNTIAYVKPLSQCWTAALFFLLSMSSCNQST